MKNILLLIVFSLSFNLFATDYQVEFFFTLDNRDFDIMEFSDETH